MSELTQELIQNALDQDFNKANATFGEIMTMKMADLLDQEKINVAGQIYNGEEPEDEDQLELDLEDDQEETMDETEDSDIEEEEEEAVQEPSGDVDEPMGDEDSEGDKG